MISPRAEILATDVAPHGGRRALAREGAEVICDFSTCLNAFGPADVVRQAILGAPIDEYPDPYNHEVRSAAAQRWNCPPANIVFGSGAAELIQAICFAFLHLNDRVVIAMPAFSEYSRAASLMGAKVVEINLFDTTNPVERMTEAIVAHRPRLTFVCSPSNPTGETWPRDQLALLADVAQENGLLVLDQAYDAFANEPLGTPALGCHPSVVHLRSMTKDHAIAGVRVAFGVAPSAIITAVERARVPWSASSAAQAAGIAVLTDEALAHVRHTVAMLRAEAARIRGELSALGIETRPSSTHFLLVRCNDARSIRARLLAEHRLLARDCMSFGLREWLRVAARTPDENTYLLHALKSVLS